MKTAIINVKTEPIVKAHAQQVAKEMGLALGSLINGFLHNLIKSRRVEFTAYAHEEPSEFMIKAMQEAVADEKQGRVSPSFNNAKKASSWLDKEHNTEYHIIYCKTSDEVEEVEKTLKNLINF